MNEAKENPQCAVHYHMIPDGQCSCPNTCDNCGVTYVGGHSKDECVTVLKNRLRLNELTAKIEALSVGREPMSHEKLIAAAKADLLVNLPVSDEQAVKQVYPDARIRKRIQEFSEAILACEVIDVAGTVITVIGRAPTSYNGWEDKKAESAAWADARSKLKSAATPDPCEGGEPCWFNQETGYTEYCPKHEAIIADKAMESPNWASSAPATIPNISEDMIRRGYKWEPVEPADKLSEPEPIEEDWQQVDRLIGNRVSGHAYAVAYWKCRQRELAVSQAENKALKHTVADLSGKVAKLCFEAQVPAERSRKAARELLSFLDISFPRGRAYANSLEETMAICIEQNMKGIHRS